MRFVFLAAACLMSSPALAQPVTIGTSGFGCSDFSDFSRALQLNLVQKDDVAAQRYILGKVSTGACILLNKGTKAYLESRSKNDLGGMKVVCLRPMGNPVCYYTMDIILQER